MNPLVLLASALLLQPVLDADAELRLAASATDGHDVHWYVDGVLVATTASGGAATVPFHAGTHDVWAITDHGGPWRAIVRPTGPIDGGDVAYVEGWSASHAPEPRPEFSAGPVVLALVGLTVAGVGRLRPKRP